MSTTKTTTSSNTANFDPNSMNRFQQLGASGGNALMDYMNDPMKSTAFNQRMQQSNLFNLNLANRNQQGTLQRMGQFGGAQMPGFLQTQMDNNQGWLSSNQSNSFNNNMFYADQSRQNAMNAGLNYRPLQTGSQGTQSQTTGGLGTWLPQVAGMGLSLATGGMGGMFGGGSGGGMPDGAYNNWMGQGNGSGTYGS